MNRTKITITDHFLTVQKHEIHIGTPYNLVDGYKRFGGIYCLIFSPKIRAAEQLHSLSTGENHVGCYRVLCWYSCSDAYARYAFHARLSISYARTLAWLYIPFAIETGFTCCVPLHPVFCFLTISVLNVNEDIFHRTVTLLLFINVHGDLPLVHRCSLSYSIVTTTVNSLRGLYGLNNRG